MGLDVLRDVPGIRLEDMTGTRMGCLHDDQIAPADLFSNQVQRPQAMSE